jgi:hypothetical protein
MQQNGGETASCSLWIAHVQHVPSRHVHSVETAHLLPWAVVQPGVPNENLVSTTVLHPLACGYLINNINQDPYSCEPPSLQHLPGLAAF